MKTKICFSIDLRFVLSIAFLFLEGIAICAAIYSLTQAYYWIGKENPQIDNQPLLMLGGVFFVIFFYAGCSFFMGKIQGEKEGFKKFANLENPEKCEKN